MPISHRTKRVRVYSYSDTGADGYVGSSYVRQDSSDADAAWWASIVAPTGRELAIAAQSQHSVDVVIGADAVVPITENGVIVDVESGEVYRVTALLPREYGRDELQALAVATDEDEPSLALAQTPARLVVTPATAAAAVGATVQLTAVLEEADTTPILGYPVTWLSLDDTRAPVDENGAVTVLVALPVTIVAMVETPAGIFTGSATINGAAVLPVASVQITLGSASVVQGGAVVALVRAFDATGAEKVGEPVTALDSSDDAVVDATGAVLGDTPLLVTLPTVAAGAADVVATVGGVDSPAAAVTVTPPGGVEVGSVTASVDPITVDEGDTVDVVLRAFDPDTAELLGQDIGVLSTDEAVFTVAPASGVTPLTVTVTGVGGGTARLIISVGGTLWEVDVTVTAAPVADPGPVMTGLTRWYRPEAAQVTAGALTDRAGSGAAMQLGASGVGDWNQPTFDAANNMIFGDADDTVLAAAANVGAEWALHCTFEFPGVKPPSTGGTSLMRLAESASSGDYALYLLPGAVTSLVGGVVAGYNIIRAIVRAAGGSTQTVRTATPSAHDPAGRPVDVLLQREASGNVVLYLDGVEVGRITTGTVPKSLTAPALYTNFSGWWLGTVLYYAGKSLSAAERTQNRDHMRVWHAGLP